jgi:hypothetical protein
MVFLNCQAVTYDSAATNHDESLCSFAVEGCSDSHASNYLEAANTDGSSSCVFPRLVWRALNTQAPVCFLPCDA